MTNLKKLEDYNSQLLKLLDYVHEYSRRSKTETHKDLERFWNQIQKLEKQLKEEA